MISHSSVLRFLTIAIVLVISNTVRAQVDPPRPTPADAQKDKETEQRQELEKKTLALLNEITSAAWNLKLPENRLFVMASAGHLLWPVDQKRARILFWDALNSLNLITPAVRSTGESLSKAEREKIVQAYFLRLGLRQKLLQQIAYRDPQLALEMLRATRPVPPQQFESELSFVDDHQLELEIATELAVVDPSQALLLARQSLAKRLTLDLLNLLRQLNQKDSEKASQLAGDIIAKLQTTNVATDFGASTIARYLLQSSRIPDVNGPANVLSAGGAKVLSLTDEQKRDLVEIVINAALSGPANSNLLYHMYEVMPEVERFFPERRAALERKVTAFKQSLGKEARYQNTYDTLISRGIPEEIIRGAAGADDSTRLSLYYQAAVVAASRGNTDWFRDFVSKEISDVGERRKALDSLDAEEISVAAKRKQLDELRSLLPRIRRKEERVRAMAELAVMLKEKGENEEATTLLDEAAPLVKTVLNDEKQTNALLTLLCAYAVVDPAKAFALAERTVDQANSQISLLMLFDRVVKSGAVKKSEVILDQGGIMPLDFFILKFGKGVVALAKADFNRTKALADRFERDELRLMAQLLILKALLQRETPTTLRFGVFQ